MKLIKQIQIPYGIKFNLKMRLTVALLLLSLLRVNATTYSQNAKISLHLENVKVETVLKEIENNSEFKIFYRASQIDVARKVNINVEKEKIKKILDFLFANTNVSYKVIDKHIVLNDLKMHPEKVELRGVDPINSDVEGEQKEINGTVSDSSGSLLPGVNVVVEGSNNGVSTDFNGNYKINAKEGDRLTFSYIGMKSVSITIGSLSEYNITLQEDASSLDEVVVVGYGTQRKADVTGSFARVRTEGKTDLSNTNVLQLIKGSVAGISVGTPDRPGEEPTFKVRGTNSISAGNSPLIVVDGIIYSGGLNNLNINDIESVDVLKDASAAAVYGSRSANGVIIISTKRGTSEKPVFNFSANYGASDPVSLIPVLSPDQYLQKVLDYRIMTNQEANPANISDYLTITEANNLAAGNTIDWYEELVKTSTVQNFNGSVSGRTDKTNYFLSGSYSTQEGIVQNDNFDRLTARANLSNDITDWFKVSLKSSVSVLDYSGSAVPLTYALSPYSNWYEEDGQTLEYYPMEDPYFRHPMLNLQIDDRDNRTNLWGLVSTELKVPFIEGLKWTMNYSVRENTTKRSVFQDNTLAITQNGSASKTNSTSFSSTFDNILNYNTTLDDVHNVSATFLMSKEYNSSEFTSASSTNFFSQALGYHSLELGGVPSVNSGFGESDQNALMGRVNYNYDNKYALTTTVRRDGYSGFAKGNKYATFLSGAFSWTLTEENFMKDIEWMDRLKLRLSYGENGNQAIGRYQTLASLTSGSNIWGSSMTNYVFGDGGGTSNGAYVNAMANNQLGWETTKVTNFGLDFNLFDSNVYGSIDIYSSKTQDLLVRRSIPSISGFGSVWTNIGEVQNNGFELSLNAAPVKKKDFSWDVGFVFDLNRNKINSLFGVDDDGDGKEDDDIANGWFIGQPLGVYYGYGIDGVHQTGDTDIPSGYQPGDFRIIDYNGDGELSPDDRHILGTRLPNYQFSISNTFKYKNWSLYAMINSIQGGGSDNHYIGNNISGHNPNAPFASWSQRFSFAAMDYWTPTNPSNTAAAVNYTAPRGHSYFEDRSFIRIQDVNLSYSFDRSQLAPIGLENLRVFLSGKNLHTFTNWTGYDPENATTISGVPMLRTITFGLDFKF